MLHTHSKKSHKCCAAGVPSLNSPSSSVIPCIPAPRRVVVLLVFVAWWCYENPQLEFLLLLSTSSEELAPDPACLPATNSVTTHILDALQLLCTVSGYVRPLYNSSQPQSMVKCCGMTLCTQKVIQFTDDDEGRSASTILIRHSPSKLDTRV